MSKWTQNQKGFAYKCGGVPFYLKKARIPRLLQVEDESHVGYTSVNSYF